MSWHRRSFLSTTAAAGMTSILGLVPSPGAVHAADASQVVRGKNGRLQILGADIAVLETPTELLGDQITPLDVLFVRNNSQPAEANTMAAAPLDGWRVEIGGLVNQAKTLEASDLLKMKQVDVEMVLQCSGNGRALFSEAAQTKGTQWLRGGMGNIRVTGVPLAAVLDKLEIAPQKSATFLNADGQDPPAPEKEDFLHSLPLQEALNHALLATKFNGQPIPAIHGGPVRLMTPGVYGTMHIKWLKSLQFVSEETDNYNQIPRYRVPRKLIKPGQPIKYTFQNSRHNWRMKVKSVILSPAPDQRVKAGQATLVRGVAFNDGAAKIDSVLVSVDQGQRWRRAKLSPSGGPYGWSHWEFPAKLTAGTNQIWSRAVDALGRSQPLDGSIHWNPSGYEWNGVEKITVVAS